MHEGAEVAKDLDLAAGEESRHCLERVVGSLLEYRVDELLEILLDLECVQILLGGHLPGVDDCGAAILMVGGQQRWA